MNPLRDPPQYIIVPDDASPDRADRALAALSSGRLTRSAAAALFKAGRVRRDGRPVKPSAIVGPGDRLELGCDSSDCAAPPESAPPPSFVVLYEDEHLLVVDKPPRLTVHPAPGTRTITLCELVTASRPEMRGVGDPERPGIVHRLDRDTSGVMVIAKTHLAHETLSSLFKAHTIHRMYLALARGQPRQDEGIIDVAIGRHTKNRKRISTHTNKPRVAITRWRVAERLRRFTLLEVFPQTGRTHQIRVHLAQAGLPVAGDPVYGRAGKASVGMDPEVSRAIHELGRQALHAALLGFCHPVTGAYMEFRSPPPQDMSRLIQALGGKV